MTSLAGAVWPSPRLHQVGSRAARDEGTSLLEVLLLLALGVAVVGGGISALADVRRERAGLEAARLLMHELQAIAYRARFEGRALGVQLSQPTNGDATWQVYADGNGDGVRVSDVKSGIDPPLGPPRRAFAEGTARLAIVHDVPTTDNQGVLAAGEAPVRFGVASYISFSPRRTGPSGSIYIAGPSGQQYAIRVLGTTGRLRLLCVDLKAWHWDGC
jgi:hypothetical protein